MAAPRTLSPALEAAQAYTRAQWLDIFEQVILTAPANVVEQLKQEKKTQAAHFIELLESQFIQLLSPLRNKYKQGDMQQATGTHSGLSILSKQEQSLQVFSESFEGRAALLCELELALLVQRFEHLVKQPLVVEDLPISPRAILEQVKVYVLGFGVDPSVQLELFKGILKEFVLNYEALMMGLNNIFIDKGVLSTLDESDGYSRQVTRQKREQAKENRNFLIADLLGEVERDSQGKVIPANMGKVLEKINIDEDNLDHALTTDSNAELIEEAKIIEHLDKVYKIEEELSDTSNSYKHRQSVGNLTQSISKNTDLTKFSLSKKNTSTIGMMSMLFEELFGDNFPEPIQALIEQLQIPLLKTALLDKSFFADSDNPAQLLLNTLVEHSRSWEPIGDPSKDFLYRKMDNIITTINKTFDGSYDVFVDALFDFDQFLEAHTTRVKRIEERIISLEKAKARQDRAREVSVEHITTQLRGGEVDESLKAFFFNEWQKVLFFTHNKYGNNNNEEWKSAVDAESKILSLLKGDSSADKREAVYALQAAMLSIGLQKSDVNRVLKRAIPLLKSYQWEETSSLGDLLDETLIESEASLQSEILELLSAAEDEVGAKSEKINARASEKKAEKKTEKKIEPVQSLSDVSQDDALDVSAEEAVTVTVEDLASLLTVGSWLLDGREDPPIKLKVAAFIKYSDTYILVTRTGVKYASFNSEEMLALLKSEQINIIESSLIFDRALETVIKNLKPKEFDMSSM